ncbi:hypothetical protein QBC35DRAFT_472686 [Podospora australis]|uniref:Uncharacterized protein n=1 Tax=Podospora australis TaxID=1536484 RepID=A0AAN7AI42_9PEZI|nr:hypothetical protein QBC35DRAFT_472686 [Podospora australis]
MSCFSLFSPSLSSHFQALSHHPSNTSTRHTTYHFNATVPPFPSLSSLCCLSSVKMVKINMQTVNPDDLDTYSITPGCVALFQDITETERQLAESKDNLIAVVDEEKFSTLVNTLQTLRTILENFDYPRPESSSDRLSSYDDKITTQVDKCLDILCEIQKILVASEVLLRDYPDRLFRADLKESAEQLMTLLAERSQKHNPLERYEWQGSSSDEAEEPQPLDSSSHPEITHGVGIPLPDWFDSGMPPDEIQLRLYFEQLLGYPYHIQALLGVVGTWS